MDGYFEMTKQEMISTVYRQLALDYNCQPEDFTRSGILFTEAKMQRGRREMPFVTPRLEVITMGKSTVVNASKSVMPYVNSGTKAATKFSPTSWSTAQIPTIFRI